MDAYSAGYLIGSTFVLAAIGYVVGRKIAGPSGISEVERLVRLAGVAEADAPPRSRWRGVVPYVFATCGALTGFVFGAFSLAHERRKTTYDPVRVEQEFLSGCSRACVGGKGDARACHEYCACLFDGLKRDQGSAESLNRFLQSVMANDPAAKSVLGVAQSRCLSEHPVSK
jgi:hypothetical protein